MGKGNHLTLVLSTAPRLFSFSGMLLPGLECLISTGSIVRIAGSVMRHEASSTRTGSRVVYVIMEDGTGVADVTVFSGTQGRCGDVLFREGWLIVKGRIQRRGPKTVRLK